MPALTPRKRGVVIPAAAAAAVLVVAMGSMTVRPLLTLSSAPLRASPSLSSSSASSPSSLTSACLRKHFSPRPSPPSLSRQTRWGVRRETRSNANANPNTNRGLGILEWAGRGGLLPQPLLVKTAKAGWREAWKLMISELAPQSKDGEYVRPKYGFEEAIGTAKHPAEPHRYHLYVGNACPWCHRVLLVKAIRSIPDESLSYTILLDDPTKASRGGWAFSDSAKDPVFGGKDLREVYDACAAREGNLDGYSGRVTAPLMVDKRRLDAVSNESEDLVRMLNEVDIDEKNGKEINVDLYPPHLREKIDDANGWIYKQLNNGVYRCGFATTQEAYNKAAADVTAALDRLEVILSTSRFVCGDKITEADIRLLPTIARYDAVYHTFFKCTNRRIQNMPNLQAWLQDMYQVPGVSTTLDVEKAKRSYFSNLFPLNPSGIIPLGPSIKELGFLENPKRGPTGKEAIFFDKAETRR